MNANGATHPRLSKYGNIKLPTKDPNWPAKIVKDEAIALKTDS